MDAMIPMAIDKEKEERREKREERELEIDAMI
jgi:hypothetical protein